MKPQAISAPPKNSDALLLFFAVAALLFELALLLFQLRLIQIPFLNNRSSSHQQEVGAVLRKARSVQYRAPGSLSWYPLGEGDAVIENDTVMTGASSSAVIRMQDGAELLLEPFTLLRFNQGTKLAGAKLALEVNRGLVKVRSRADTVTFALGNRILALTPQTEVALTADQANKPAELEVLQGALKLSQGQSLVSLKAGQAVSFSGEKQAQPISTRLKIEAYKPASGSRVYYSGEKSTLEFSWKGDVAPFLEYDTSPQMESPERVKTEGDRALLTLASGKYYWRLIRDGAKSSVMEFSVLPEAKYRVSSGPANFKEGMPVLLHWGSVPDADMYSLQISRDRSFRNLASQLRVKENETELSPLPKGKYFWRVRATNSYLGDWPESEVFELNIKKRMAPPVTKGAKVIEPKKSKENKKNRTDYRWKGLWRGMFGFVAAALQIQALATPPEKIWLEFNWEAVKNARAYRLEISASKDFRKLVSSTEGSRSTAVVEVPDRDRYFWRVAAIDEDGDLGKFSAVQTVRRELAKVKPPPTRQVSALPSPPSVAPETLAAIRSEPQEAPRQRFFHTWLGYGATYFNQQMSGDVFLVRSQGLPVNRVVLGLSEDFEKTTLEGNFWFQPLDYHTQGTQSSFFQNQWGADLFWSRLAWRKTLPLGLGLRLRSEQAISAISASDVTLKASPFGALLVGTTWVRPSRWFWTSTLCLELGPFGERKGLGVVWRNRVALPVDWVGLKPSMEVIFNPQYRSVPGVGSTEWNIEASVSFVLEWISALPAIGGPKLQ